MPADQRFTSFDWEARLPRPFRLLVDTGTCEMRGTRGARVCLAIAAALAAIACTMALAGQAAASQVSLTGTLESAHADYFSKGESGPTRYYLQTRSGKRHRLQAQTQHHPTRWRSRQPHRHQRQRHGLGQLRRLLRGSARRRRARRAQGRRDPVQLRESGHRAVDAGRGSQLHLHRREFGQRVLQGGVVEHALADGQEQLQRRRVRLLHDPVQQHRKLQLDRRGRPKPARWPRPPATT